MEKFTCNSIDCWVGVIFFTCLCVGASDMTTASDDTSSSVLCVVYTRCFPRGGPRGAQVLPPLVTRSVRGNAPKKNFDGFCYF
jgi:hypothetical protein